MSALARSVPALPLSPSEGRAPDPRAQKLVVLEALRARYGRSPSVSTGQLAMGVPGLTTWLGGWPVGALTEIAGPPGSGRLALVLPALRLLASQGRTVVFVDPGQVIHPPAFPELYRSLLLLRPPPAQAGWVAEQVARSGAVPLVVLVDLPAAERGGVRLVKAAEAGRSAVVALSPAPGVDLPAALRLSVEGWVEPQVVQVRCTRARDGRSVGARRVGLQGRVLEGRWPAGVDA